MNNIINRFEELEKSAYMEVRNVFYFLCKESSPLEIKKCFIKKAIRTKLTEEVISFGLMGCAEKNIANLQALMDCIKQYQEIDLVRVSYSAAINNAIENGDKDCMNLLLKNEICLNSNQENIYSLDYSSVCATGSIPRQMTAIENQYINLSKSPLKFFSHNSDQLESVFLYDIPYKNIVRMTYDAIYKNNIIPLVALVKSKYLDKILGDEGICTFMDNGKDIEIKQEFIHLIEDSLLNKKLNDKLPYKNNKTNTIKI